MSLRDGTRDGLWQNYQNANARPELSGFRPLETDVMLGKAMQDIRARYPFLDYAILYTFYHLNRSGPLCSIILSKIEAVLQSERSLSWLKDFTQLQFEDLTLVSQVEEYVNLQKTLANIGLDNHVFQLFAQTVKRLRRQKQSSREEDKTASEGYQEYLNIVSDEDLEAWYRENCYQEPEEARETLPNTTCVDSQPQIPNLSTAASRIRHLLSNEGSLPVHRQIELYLRLNSVLRKARVLVDPLKILFELILSKTSKIPVYALIVVADFYSRVDKDQEALEVAAAKKVEHVDSRIKFDLYENMASVP